jgi:hypothetical protein
MGSIGIKKKKKRDSSGKGTVRLKGLYHEIHGRD